MAAAGGVSGIGVISVENGGIENGQRKISA